MTDRSSGIRKASGLRSWFVIVLVVVSLVSPGHAGAASVSAVQVSTTAHGVRLSLSIPRQTYPKNALVTVTVRLHNASRHTVLVSGNDPLTVTVFDSSHQAVYWPREPLGENTLFDLHGPGPRPPMKLRPHRVLVFSDFVILRGPLLQARAMIGPRGKEHALAGPLLPLTLTDEATPAVTVAETPTLHATITPPTGVSGSPYFVEQTQCADNGMSTGRGWQAAPTNVLTPEFATDCVSPRAWVALVGWLNHPVVSIDYTAPTG